MFLIGLPMISSLLIFSFNNSTQSPKIVLLAYDNKKPSFEIFDRRIQNFRIEKN